MITEKKKILVTGATGFIGSALLTALVAKGYEVVYLTSNKDKLSYFGEKVQGYFWDVEKGILAKDSLKAVDVIIHLAGENISGSWSAKGKEGILRSRVDSSKLLYKALAESDHKVKQIICASAIGLYASKSTLQEEGNFTVAENFLGDVVSAWEKENSKFEDLGIAVALVRIGLVLDKRGGALPIMAKAVNYFVGAPFGSGKQYYSWIHKEDLIGIFCHIVALELEGVYNGVAPTPVSNKAFTLTLGKVLHRPIFPMGVPAFLLKALIGEKSSLILEGQHVSAQKILATQYRFKFEKLSDALHAIYDKVRK